MSYFFEWQIGLLVGEQCDWVIVYGYFFVLWEGLGVEGVEVGDVVGGEVVLVWSEWLLDGCCDGDCGVFVGEVFQFQYFLVVGVVESVEDFWLVGVVVVYCVVVVVVYLYMGDC